MLLQESKTLSNTGNGKLLMLKKTKPVSSSGSNTNVSGNNDSRGNKRQLSPNGGGGDEVDDDDGNSAWSVMSGSRSRRNKPGHKSNEKATVTPIVIRRNSYLAENAKATTIVFGSDDEMEQDGDEKTRLAKS